MVTFYMLFILLNRIRNRKLPRNKTKILKKQRNRTKIVKKQKRMKFHKKELLPLGHWICRISKRPRIRLLQASLPRELEWVSWHNGMSCTEKVVLGSKSSCHTSCEKFRRQNVLFFNEIVYGNHFPLRQWRIH